MTLTTRLLQIFDRAERIPGFFSRREMRVLADLAGEAIHPFGRVVEVGSWQGRSAYVLASLCRDRGARLYCLDTFRGCPGRPLSIYAEAERDPDFIRHIRANLAEFGTTVEIVPGDSQVTFREIGSCDLVFLDGDHDSPGFDADVANAWSRLRPGGILCGHNFGDAEYPDVQRVVTRWFPEVTTVGSVWSVRRPLHDLIHGNGVDDQSAPLDPTTLVGVAEGG